MFKIRGLLDKNKKNKKNNNKKKPLLSLPSNAHLVSNL